MKSHNKVMAAVAVLLLAVAGFVWLRAYHKEQRHTPVLDRPIRFERGFAFTSTFTTRYSGVYEVEIVCQRTQPRQEMAERQLIRELPVEFTIACEGKVVAEGGAARHSGRFSNREAAATLARFSAEANKSLELSFRILKDLPELGAIRPNLKIGISRGEIPRDLVDLFMHYTVAQAITCVALLFALSPCCCLAQKFFRSSGTNG